MRTKILLLLTYILVAIGAHPQSNKAKARPQTTAKTVSTMTPKQKALYEGMLPNTREVFVIDSMVVDFDKLPQSIPLPKDYGRIVAYNNFFGTDKQPSGYVYVNGFGNKCFYSEMAEDSTMHLYSRSKLNGEWSEPQLLQGLDDGFTNMNFPCMMSDGTTMYFSAESKDGLGGQDIYVTSYEADEGRFLQAENVGLPFNSHDDDLLYVEDDTDSLAWLASTRRQPKGKVCIYTIALSGTRQNYDADEMEDDELRSLASIASIKDTWPTAEKRQAALAKLSKVEQRVTKDNGEQTDLFIIDDNTAYSKASDFSTAENKRLYENMLRKQRQRKELTADLELLRVKYHKATATERKRMTQDVLKMERDLQQLDDDLAKDANTLRRNEQAAKK